MCRAAFVRWVDREPETAARVRRDHQTGLDGDALPCADCGQVVGDAGPRDGGKVERVHRGHVTYVTMAKCAECLERRSGRRGAGEHVLRAGSRAVIAATPCGMPSGGS